MTRSKPTQPKSPVNIELLGRLISARHYPIAGAALLGLFLSPAISAATINVTPNAVDNVVNGNCSIVEAIQSANSNTQVDNCTAGSGASNTIMLPSKSTFTFDGTNIFTAHGYNALPDITSTVTIQGNGSTLRNTAAPDNGGLRLIHVGSGTLTLQDTTITGGIADSSDTNGAYGGGIYVSTTGTLTLTDSKVSNNTAYVGGGGLHVAGNATISNSTFSNNLAYASSGGAVSITGAGAAALTDSTLSGNTAGANGGGIYDTSSGRLTVLSSTLSGNTADYSGGALAAQSGLLTITNSTISGNTTVSSGGGLYLLSTTATLTNDTISANKTAVAYGGGIYIDSAATTTMRNTIVAAQKQGGDCLIVDSSSFATTGAPNLQSDASCNGFTINNAGFTLGALAANGGPTKTQALLTAGSGAAIDAGNDGVCAEASPGPNNLDQRGKSRVAAGAHCDLGAYEVVAAASSSGGGGGGGGGGALDVPALLGLLGLWAGRFVRRRSQ